MGTRIFVVKSVSNMKNIKIIEILWAIILIGFFEDNLIRATNASDIDMKTLMERQDEKIGKAMNILKNQQEEINNIKVENRKQQINVSNLQKKNQQHEESIDIMQKENEHHQKVNNQQQTKYIQQQKIVEMLQDENFHNKDKMAFMELDFKKINEENMYKLEIQTFNIESMKKVINTFNETTSKHETSINVLRDAPELHQCGYKASASTQGPLPFDYLFYSSTNQPTGGIDLESGVFTSPFPGTYTITWSFYSEETNRYVFIYLNKNGEQIYESLHYSYHHDSSKYSVIAEQGGRTMILHLDMGETVSLDYDRGEAIIYRLMFCVSLSSYDQIEA